MHACMCAPVQAWADSLYTWAWAKWFCDMIERECPGEDHLLYLDELGCQMSEVVRVTRDRKRQRETERDRERQRETERERERERQREKQSD